MIKTQLKLERLKQEIARQQARQETQKLARRRKRKADQQRRRNAAKAALRAIESRQPTQMNLAGNPFRDDPAEQKRAAHIRWRLETAQGVEVRSLSAWCDYIHEQTGFLLSPLDLETILRDEAGYSLADVLESVRAEMKEAAHSAIVTNVIRFKSYWYRQDQVRGE